MTLKAHLVNTNWFSPELDLIHDLTGILGVLFRQKLAEPETLMGV